MRERSGTNKSGNPSINFSSLLWLLLCGLIAALIAGFLLLVLVLITPPDATMPAIAATPARLVMNHWKGDLLMVQCAGFQPGDNVIIFITPSMADVNSTREGITVLQAGPQGNCPPGGVRVDAETASRQGWQLVALGSRAGDIANTPFIASPEAARQTQPRQAIPAQVQPAALETKPSPSTGQYQESLVAPDPQNAPLQQGTPDPGSFPPDEPFVPGNRPCIIPPPANIEGKWCVEYYRDRDQDKYPVFVDVVDPINDEVLIDWRNTDWPPRAGDIPASNYRIVFIGSFNFSQTRSYRFTLRVRGSARVHVDDRLVIDSFPIGNKRSDTFYLPVSSQTHTIKLEYYLDGGPSSIFLSRKPDGNRNDFWLGRYYDNATREGAVVMIRQDPTIDFVWDGRQDLELNPLNPFSVQWLRAYYVPRNGMICNMFALGRVRVYVDGRLVPELSNWDSANAWDRTAVLNAGRRFVEVHFEKQSLPAQIRFTCNPVTPAY